MNQYTYYRNDDGTLERVRLQAFDGLLVDQYGEVHVPCRDCGEPIGTSEWNGRCLPCHESIAT